jgi:hypothetical protein
MHYIHSGAWCVMDTQPRKLWEVRFSAQIPVEGRLLLHPGYSRLCFLCIDVLNSSYNYLSNLFFSIHFDFRISSDFIWFGLGPGRHAFGGGSGAARTIRQAVAYSLNWH